MTSTLDDPRPSPSAECVSGRTYEGLLAPRGRAETFGKGGGRRHGERPKIGRARHPGARMWTKPSATLDAAGPTLGGPSRPDRARPGPATKAPEALNGYAATLPSTLALLWHYFDAAPLGSEPYGTRVTDHLRDGRIRKLGHRGGGLKNTPTLRGGGATQNSSTEPMRIKNWVCCSRCASANPFMKTFAACSAASI